MRNLLKCLLVSVLLFSLSLPLITTQAQDGGDLSEEELALLDQLITSSEALQEYPSYAFNRFDSENTTLSLGEDQLLVNTWIRRYGYRLNTEESEKVAFHAFFQDQAEPLITIEGDIIQIDDIVYATAEYLEGAENGETMPEGWQIITSVEEIPLAMEDLGIDDLFDDTTPLMFEEDLLMEYATAITLEETTLVNLDDEEIAIERITVTIEGEDFLPFYLSVLDEVNLQNPIIQALFTEDLFGYFNIAVSFDESGEIVLISGFLDIQNIDVDAYAANPDVFAEGDILGIEGGFYVETYYSEHNADFDPIEAPQID